MELSRDGRHLAYTINEGGFSRLVLHDTVQQADVLLPALPQGAVIEELGVRSRQQAPRAADLHGAVTR